MLFNLFCLISLNLFQEEVIILFKMNETKKLKLNFLNFNFFQILKLIKLHI